MEACRKEQLVEAARSVAIAVVAYFATVAAIRAAVWAWRTQSPAEGRRPVLDGEIAAPARCDADGATALSPELADLWAEALCQRQEA